jgi:hypothetical protein
MALLPRSQYTINFLNRRAFVHPCPESGFEEVSGSIEGSVCCGAWNVRLADRGNLDIVVDKVRVLGLRHQGLVTCEMIGPHPQTGSPLESEVCDAMVVEESNDNSLAAKSVVWPICVAIPRAKIA